VRLAAVALVACSSSVAPLRNTAPADRPASRSFPGLSIQFDDQPVRMFGERGACLVSGDTLWKIDVPAADDACNTGSRPRDDWFTLELPRCGAARCPVPPPRASYDIAVNLVRHAELDDVLFPVTVRVTVKRHEPPLVILGFIVLAIADNHGISRVEMWGELAVRFDDESLVDPASWRR
jgi:hypothetical protein